MASTISELARLKIPLADVVEATNNFHHDNIIGYGDFGPAYKGQLLRSGKLMTIVARRLDRKHGLGGYEFLNEVSVLSTLNHKNLVSIIGFCDEEEEKIIITTYAANGSLGQFLNSPNLKWTQRLRICVDVARALSYLHSGEGRGYFIIHRFINSSTILLDESWEPKLSGFEISVKQSVYYKDYVFPCEPIGIIGYMDPTAVTTRGVTYKSDIYSFGVVLFEILYGRKAFIKYEDNSFLAQLAKSYYEKEKLNDIIHPYIRNQMSSQSLLIYSKVAYSCLKDEHAHRPDMDYVVNELTKALEFQLRLENLGKNLEHSLKIPLSDIKLITQNFSKRYKIGSTRFYNLYKVELNHFGKENPSFVEGMNKDKQPKKDNTVVIKRMLPGDDQYTSEEMFCMELDMLTSAKHRNIVTLIGVCDEDCEMILVKEHPLNGYLGDYLGKENGMRNFTWAKRLKICIDVAHALNYLHFEMEDKKVIINRDIKSFNIALDENWVAKIVDFGFSIFLPSYHDDEALHTDQLYGTKFYIDPEYEKTGKLRRESDVYSFGVVLFEILCGRLATDPIHRENNDKGVARVARKRFRMGKLQEMIDPIIKEETGAKNFPLNIEPNNNSLGTFVEIANKCIAETQDKRPKMNVVVNALEDALRFQEGRVQHKDMEGIVDEAEMGPELNFKHEISGQDLEHLKIPLRAIKSATRNFSTRYRLGSTDLYTWYGAKLDRIDKENPSFVEGKVDKSELSERHRNVLIKRIHPRDDNDNEQAFYRELEVLSCVKHPNIVTLFGFCHEDSEMILVIENVSNGSLDEYLRKESQGSCDMSSLNWETRLIICIGIAKAVKYLHFEMDDQKVIIIRDIQSQNIALDENFGAKLVDFGFSVFLPPKQEEEALNLKKFDGSPYVDPEYMKTGKLKKESDVYSFGVILFELLSGRIADPVYVTKSDKGLQDVARRSFYTGTPMEMIDPIIKEETGENNFFLKRGPNKESLETFINIALKCVAETQDKRPTMKDVVMELEYALSLQKNNKDKLKISLEDIELATENFHAKNYIAEGGFGKVFKGELLAGDARKTIVAKRLKEKSDQVDQQFSTELQILSEYKHENIIGLVGYCAEKGEKIIVYEYALRGSIGRYLKEASLLWIQRLNICIDVASALEFLHGGVGKQAKVVHRDIKSDNILVTHDWKAKLADFGLSIISSITHRTDYIIKPVGGTLGYMDPLYEESRVLTIESDIYSFGMVMFEILCGRPTYEIHKGKDLPHFIKRSFEEGKQDEVVFSQIREQIMPKSLTTFQEIAYKCLHREREKRPPTHEVLQELKKAKEFQVSHDASFIKDVFIDHVA